MGLVGRKFLVVLAVSTALLSGCDDRPDGAPELVTAFSNGCVSKGRWTDAALTNSQALTQYLKDLKDSDPCKTFATQVASIQSAATSINALYSDANFKAYREADQALQDMLLTLSQATDPNMVALLQASVVQLQTQLATARATSFVEQDSAKRDRIATQSQQLVNLAQNLTQNSSAMVECLRSSPVRAVELATNLGTMGASIASPIYGAGAAVIGSLINLGVEAIGNAPIDNALRDEYREQMKSAVTCGLEAMTELECQASETVTLVNLQAQHYPAPGAGTVQEAWQGLDIYSRRLPILIRWLRDLRNGREPDDNYISDKVNDAEDLKLAVEDAGRSAVGSINDFIRVFIKTPDGATRDTSLVIFVEKMATGLAPGSNPYSGMTSSRHNPFSSLSQNPYTFACWLAKGYNAAECVSSNIPVPTNTNTSVEDFVRNNYLSLLKANLLALQEKWVLKANWADIYDAALTYAESQIREAHDVDSGSVINRAREKGPDGALDSVPPLQVLKMLRDFLWDMSKNPRVPPGRQPLLHDTMKLLDRAIELIELPDPLGRDLPAGTNPAPSPSPVPSPSASPSPTAEQVYNARVKELYDLFELRSDVLFFEDRISNFILWDVNDRLSNGEFGAEAAEILRYLGGDVRSSLLAAGSGNLLAVLNDLNLARSTTEGTLRNFRGYMEPVIGQLVDRLGQDSAAPYENPVGVDRPNGQVLGELCALILSTNRSDEEWPAGISWDVCSKASFYYAGDPATAPHFTIAGLRDELNASADKTVNYRSCAYHRFVRQVRVREILQGLGALPTPTPVPHGLLEGLFPFLGAS